MNDRTLVHALARAIMEAAQSFDAGRDWPAALLWPDPERQWFSAFADLRRRLAAHKVALYAIGDYAPEDGIGPAVWLRCLIDAPNSPALKGVVGNGALPIILLPGTSWRALREHIMTLSHGLQMLVEMQYRGEVFRQRKQARDWTVATFLRDPDQGLGLNASVDGRTDEAARGALAALLDLDLESWRGRPVGADDFNRLLVPDDVRDLLMWIANPDAVRKAKDDANWNAFRDQVKREYAIDLDQKGSLQTAVERLARRTGAWRRVWNRLADSPRQFRPVCERIRDVTRIKQGNLLQNMEEAHPETNPHDNALAETFLARALGEVAALPGQKAAEKVIALEQEHRARRDTLWARLDEAPLAKALEPLARLAAAVEQTLPGDDLASMAGAYSDEGWRVDDALIEAIAAAGTREEIVARAANALYRPWVDATSRRFRTVFEAAGDAARPNPLAIEQGMSHSARAPAWTMKRRARARPPRSRSRSGRRRATRRWRGRGRSSAGRRGGRTRSGRSRRARSARRRGRWSRSRRSRSAEGPVRTGCPACRGRCRSAWPPRGRRRCRPGRYGVRELDVAERADHHHPVLVGDVGLPHAQVGHHVVPLPGGVPGDVGGAVHHVVEYGGQAGCGQAGERGVLTAGAVVRRGVRHVGREPDRVVVQADHDVVGQQRLGALDGGGVEAAVVAGHPAGLGASGNRANAAGRWSR